MLTECQHPEVRKQCGWSLLCKSPGMIYPSPDNCFLPPVRLLCSSLKFLLFFFSHALDFSNFLSSFICIDLMGLSSAEFKCSAKLWFSRHSANGTVPLHSFSNRLQHTCLVTLYSVMFCFWSSSLFPTWSYVTLFPFLPCQSHLLIESLCMRKTRLEILQFKIKGIERMSGTIKFYIHYLSDTTKSVIIKCTPKRTVQFQWGTRTMKRWL